MVELEAVLRARVVEGDGELRPPVLRAGGAKREEHRLEERAALVAALQFLGRDVESPNLQPQAIDQFLRAAAISKVARS